jgi:hypothetical protein
MAYERLIQFLVEFLHYYFVQMSCQLPPIDKFELTGLHINILIKTND